MWYQQYSGAVLPPSVMVLFLLTISFQEWPMDLRPFLKTLHFLRKTIPTITVLQWFQFLLELYKVANVKCKSWGLQCERRHQEEDSPSPLGGFTIKSDNFLQKGILTLLSIFYFHSRAGQENIEKMWNYFVLKKGSAHRVTNLSWRYDLL